MKYTWEFKLDCVTKHKNGISIEMPGMSSFQRTNFMKHVHCWAKNYEDLGIDGLKHCSTNKEWTPEQRFELVAKVLAGNTMAVVAKNAHINIGQLFQWVRCYNERGMMVTM